MDTWRITPEERAKHDAQFEALKPSGGFIKGEQAKGFLMQSGLPGTVLGQIWGLADMNADGMMDKREFSIAMFLIQRKLRGAEIPSVLPESLKADPSAGFMSPGSMKPRAQTFGSPGMDGAMAYTRFKHRSQTVVSGGGPGADWAIPAQSRARYQQTFTARDAGRKAHLTGAEARGVLMESGLPQGVLAQIWNLADIDNDGRLTLDEFIVAMFLIESAKAGQAMPAVLPPSVVPPSCRKTSPSMPTSAPLVQPASSALAGLSMGPSPPLGGPPMGAPLSSGLAGLQMGAPMGGGMMGGPTPGQPPDSFADIMSAYKPTGVVSPPLGSHSSGGQSPQSGGMEIDDSKTFEDRRKENFDKGQAELEKRRALLREQQKAEEEKRLALERAEQEKREQQRLEQERKKQQELEEKLQRQREVEQEKEEQRRKAMEQREAARRELERQRQVEWERQRMEQLTVEKNRIKEEVLQLKNVNSNTATELETLENKKNEVVGKIEQSTLSVKDITSSIERMRQSRDVKLADIERLAAEVQERESKQKRYDDEVAELTLQLETNMESNPVSDSYKAVKQGLSNKQAAIEKLKKDLEAIQENTSGKQADLDNNNTELQSLNNQIATVKSNIQKLLVSRQAAQKKKLPSQSSLGQKGDGQSSWFDTFEDKSVFSNSSVSPAPGGTADTAGTGSVTSSTGQPVEDSWATFAEDAGQGQDKKISQGIWEDAFSSKETAGSAETRKGVSRFRVLYPFEARHQDELTVNPGDIVMVNDDQSGVDKDWIGGEVNGKYGWFPEAYAEKIEDAAPAPATNDLFAEDKFAFGGATTEETSTDALQGALTAVKEVEQTLSAVPQDLPSLSNAASPVPGGGQPAPEGLQAQAMFSWRAKKDNHLTFNKGDVINVEEQQEMWWSGSVDGRTGWFPKSYVKLISGGARDSRSGTPLGQERRDSGPVVPQEPTVVAPSKGESYVAMYTYQSNEAGDLCFNQGDVISVTQKDGDWWTGILGTRTGIFPGNYVQKVESQPEAPANTVDSPVPPPDTPAQSLDSPARAGTPVDGATAQGLKLGGKKPEIASVIAAYHATGSEQLSLSPGQLILIRKRSPSGWWEGELQARGQKKKIGWFPANYVKVLAQGSSARSTPVQSESQRSTPQPAMAEPTMAPPAVAAVTAAPAAPSPVTAPAPAVSEQVVAIYSYDAQNVDELTFPRDAVINVVNKDDPDWWKGELNGKTGLFPSNYIKPLGESDVLDIPRTAQEKKRQHYINELIETEETYVEDMSIVQEIFAAPMLESKLLTEAEVNSIFVNWDELVHCNSKLVRAFRVRKRLNGDVGKPIPLIGDILCEYLPHMTPYIRYCSCQLKAASLIQAKTENIPEFKDLTKNCVKDPRAKGMPLSSFLLKPMQRITKYPLMISKVLEHTPEDHPDRHNLTDALAKAEELCSQVNEGVREKEHSDQLEWIQTHVIVEGLPEKLTFNSVTNCVGPRKFLHCGTLHKVKNGKELVAFLFNDILLLTLPNKPIGNVNFQFTAESKMLLRMYKTPIFLNEIAVRSPSESESADQMSFIISHIDRVYHLRAVTANERDVWMRKLDEASKNYMQIERKRRERACSLARPPCGILMVTLSEGHQLVPNPNKGKSDPYCEVSMGSQEHKTKVINGTLNPKWNSSMQFTIKDLDQDVLCITVYDRDLFSPNDFMGRTEIRIADIRKDTREKRGPITKRLALHEVESGEVTVKLDLQLYDEPQMMME